MQTASSDHKLTSSYMLQVIFNINYKLNIWHKYVFCEFLIFVSVISLDEMTV